MAKEPVELIKGTLDMLILKAIQGEGKHGFAIARWIEGVTDQRLAVDEGALYPALHRMEKRGWISSAWEMTENSRRARIYSTTPVGEEELQARLARWEGSAWAVQRVLEAKA